MEDQRPFFKNMLKSTFKTKVGNPEEISSPVVSAIEENTRAIKDKEVAKQISKPIVTALVDVMKKIEKRKDADESEMNSLLERVKMLKGDQGESADEDFIISAVVPQVLEKVGEVIKPLIPEPIPGKNGDDYILTEKDKKEIAKSIKVPVVEKVIEKQFETIIEKQPVVTNEIKEVAVTDKAEVIKEKLESLEGDDRLDAKAIKNLPKSVFGGGGGIKRIDAANDTRIISPTNGQVLKWNSTRQVWENGTASGGGTGTVDTIVAGNNIDVDATDPANPIVSVETLTLADISDVTATATEVNYTDGVTSAIQTQLDGKQPLDSDLTTIAGLTATTDNFLQSKSSAWASRTPTQVTADLIAMVGDSGSGGTKGLVPAPASGDATKVLSGAGTWVVNGAGGSGITRTVVVTSGSATMGSTASTDYAYFVAGAHTMSLPAASGNTNRYSVKNNHSANITVDTAGAETVEGAASISIAPEESVDLMSNGTNWFVI